MLPPSLAARVQATRPPPGSLGLFWLGQAGFALRGADTTLLIDPFLAEGPERLVPPADRPEAFDFVDAVLATHEHWDHLDLAIWPTLAAADPGTRFVVPRPVLEQVVAAGISADRVIGAEPDVELRFGSAGSFRCRLATASTSPTPTTSATSCRRDSTATSATWST